MFRQRTLTRVRLGNRIEIELFNAWKTTVFGITAVEESSPMGKRRTTPQRLKRPETYQSLPRSKNFY
jgi:hypothetical protein